MTKLFDSPIEHEVPVLVQLAEPAKLLKVADLSDLNHPVNNKSLSGKQKGAAVLIGNTIYMATGSQPDDTWEVFGTVNGIPADAMLKSVYDKDGSGAVDKAEVANAVTGSDSASVNQYYGTNAAGTVGWYDLPSITLDVDALKQTVDKNTQDIASANQNISDNTKKIAEHEAKIQKNLDSVADLAKQGETFTYAGSAQPSYPASAQGNYVSVFKNLGSTLAVKTPSPASGMKEGSVFTVFNDDPTHSIALSSSDSSLNSGNVVTIPSEHFASFVFKSGSYVELESGYIPSSKINLLNYVKQEVGSGAMLPRSLTQDIEGLKTGQQVLQQNIDQKISGVRIQDDSGNDLSDLSHIKVKGGTIQRVISKAGGTPQAELIINPLFSVATGQGLGATSMDARGLIFPQATISSSPTDPNLAEVNFNTSGTYPIIVDDTTYSYKEVEFMDFTATKVGDKLQLTAPQSPSSSGIEIDNGTSNLAGVTKINFPTSEFLARSPKEVDIKPYVTISSQTEGKSVLSEKVGIQPPLKVFSDPNEQFKADIYIDPAAYEPQHAPSFLAKLNSNEQISGRTRGASDEHDGVLFFDNQIAPAGEYISVNRGNKSYGIQDPTNDDPNVTGGTVTELLANFGFIGKAPSDGVIRCYFRVKPTGGFPEQYLMTADGKIAGVQINYKAGEEFKPELLTALVKVKGLEYIKVHVMHTFQDYELLMDSEVTYFCINQFVNGYKTSIAREAFQSRLGISILPDIQYIGEDYLNLSYSLGFDMPETVVPANSGLPELNETEFQNLTEVKASISGKVLTITDNNKIADFYVSQTLDNTITRMMRGNNAKFDVTLIDKDDGWGFSIYKWTGAADKVTDLYSSRNNGSLVLNAGWSLVKAGFISEDVVSGEHNATVEATVPNDAVNLRCALYPISAQQPITLKLSQFKFSPYPAFTGYLENAPSYANELHLEQDDEFKQLTQDNQGFYSLRYTVGDGETPMPSGVLGKGLADISLDTSIHQISGSAAKGGEGAIRFGSDGTATISTSVNIFNETGTENEVTFWYGKYNGSTWDKIADSETALTIPSNTKVDSTRKNEHNLATFTIAVEAGARIGLFAQASVADGAYLESVSETVPLLQTDIEFKELVAEGGDDPWADVDFTSFDKVYTRQVFAEKIVNGSQTATFTLDLPVGGTFDILNVLGSADGTYSTISPQEYSFSWDSATNTAEVDFKRNGDYRIFFVLMLP